MAFHAIIVFWENGVEDAEVILMYVAIQHVLMMEIAQMLCVLRKRK